MPPLSETLVEPDSNDPRATILELDELWSFVFKKTIKSWIWIALCRKTRQVVARAVGDRVKKPVVSYGITFQKYIAKDIVIQILESISGGYSRRAAYSSGKGNR